MYKFNWLIISFLLFSVFISCRKKEYKNTDSLFSVVVTNEGVFNAGTGSITLYDAQNKSTWLNPIYDVNKSSLGDVALATYLVNNEWWVVVNNSDRIIVVDPYTYRIKSTIDGLKSPRYLCVTEKFVYTGGFYTDTLYIIDRNSHAIRKQQLPYHSPESIVNFNNKIIIACWDTACHQLLTYDESIGGLSGPINISGISAPNELVVDNNNLFVLSGNPYYGFITKLSSSSNTLSAWNTRTVGTLDAYSRLQVYQNDLYLIGTSYSGTGKNGLYKAPKSTMDFTDKPYIDAPNGSSFYGLGISQDGLLYISDPKSYTNNSTVYIYDRSSNLVDTFQAGIIASHFLFL